MNADLLLAMNLGPSGHSSRGHLAVSPGRDNLIRPDTADTKMSANQQQTKGQLRTLAVKQRLFFRIFSYDPTQGKPDFDRLCEASLEDIQKLAKAASCVHIRSSEDMHVTCKPNSDPIMRLRQGRSMNLTVDGKEITEDLAYKLWEGPAAVIQHMISVGGRHANHAIQYSFYASPNPNCLNIINKSSCGWTQKKNVPIEIYVDAPSHTVSALGYSAEKKNMTDVSTLDNKSAADLEEEVAKYRHEGIQCYTAYEHTKCLVQESIGKLPRLTPSSLRDKLADARKGAESAMHPSLCLDQVIEIMKDVDTTIQAFRRYGKELKEYKEQTVSANVTTEHMRLLLLEHMEQIPRLSKEGLKAKLDEAAISAKKFLEPSLAVNQQKMLLQDLEAAIKTYHEQGERLEMITSKYHLPLRFQVGDPVYANVGGGWQQGTVVKTWEMGYPYRVNLADNSTVWITEDLPVEIRGA